MATTVPYAAPYARTGTEVRQAPRINSRVLPYVFLCVCGVLAIALAQLYLAGLATDASYKIKHLEESNALLKSEIDALQAEIERLRSPRRIEADSLRLRLVPLTDVEYIR